MEGDAAERAAATRPVARRAGSPAPDRPLQGRARRGSARPGPRRRAPGPDQPPSLLQRAGWWGSRLCLRQGFARLRGETCFKPHAAQTALPAGPNGTPCGFQGPGHTCGPWNGAADFYLPASVTFLDTEGFSLSLTSPGRCFGGTWVPRG